MAFSKSLQKGQIPVDCELCDGRNKIQCKCLDCDLLMCSRCKEKVHDIVKNAIEHRIKDIKDLGQQEEVDTFNFSDVKCLDHSDQGCCVYCKTCKKVICLKCVTSVHKGHTYILEEDLNGRKKTLRSGQKKAERSLNGLSSSLDKVQDIKEQEESKFRKIKQAILCHKEAFKSEVDQYADNLVKDLEQTRESNSQLFGKVYNKMKNAYENLKSTSNTAKNVSTSKDFVKFFDDFDELSVSLNKNEPLRDLEFSLLGRFIPGKINKMDFGRMENGGKLDVQHFKIEFQIVKQFTTQLRHVNHIDRCSDGTLWIYDGINKKLQYIKFDKDNIEIMLELDKQIFGMVGMNASNNLLIVAGGETRLKIINSTTGQITDSNYDSTSFISFPQCVHITNDQRIVVVIGERGKQAAVILMDEDGRHLATYEQDSNKEQLFTDPKRVASTKKGNICVIDMVDSDHRRVVVVGKDGELKQIYTGHPTINFDGKPFRPVCLLTTPADNIVIPDLFTSTLHVLNCDGNFIGYYNVHDIGIIYPCSLALSTEGHMYIGCSNKEGSPETLKAKLYELEYSGF
ncbi:uncharacterized protein LOC143048507 [Mytilus galloprovincialis]|uniref:uncharacterized protein LOC143048507 n=1 Tax=Mytilus galloprovincialis TaxID=29158 RepID=UPI003F7B7B68